MTTGAPALATTLPSTIVNTELSKQSTTSTKESIVELPPVSEVNTEVEMVTSDLNSNLTEVISVDNSTSMSIQGKNSMRPYIFTTVDFQMETS